MRGLISVVLLFILWLLLSGHYDSLLLSLGITSCIFITWLSLKLTLFKEDYSTFKFSLNLPRFLPWFFIQVIKSNIDVSWRILHPKLPVDPVITSISVTEHNDIGRAVYANCITLTPGTYTLEMDKEHIEVHSLNSNSGEELQKGAISKRILALEGNSNKSTSEQT